MRYRRDLEPQELDLLRRVIARHSPQLAPLLSESSPRLSDSEREELRLAVADEILARGLDRTDEHTEYGRTLEDLIDRLGKF